MLRTRFVIAISTACLLLVSGALQSQVIMRLSSQPPGTAIVETEIRISGTSRVPSDPMTMLRLPQFGEELELNDSQLEQIRQIQEEMAQEQKTMYTEMKTQSGPAPINWEVRQTLMREKQTEIREKSQSRLDAVLLPHQQERLQQLRVQMDLRNKGVLALASPELADILSLTDEQKQELAKKHMETQRKLQETIQKLREEFRAEVIGEVLTESQRRKLQQMAGDAYEVRTPDYSAMRKRTSSASSPQKKAEPAKSE